MVGAAQHHPDKEYKMGMREIYLEKADSQLHEWQAWIEDYKATPPVTAERNVAGWQQMTARLEDCQQTALACLEDLRGAQGERWELSKQAVERAMIDLKRALDESGAGQLGKALQLQSSRAHAYEPFSRRG